MKFFFGKLASSKKIDTHSKKKFNTNPPERSFKIWFKNFSQEDLSWKFFWARIYFFWRRKFWWQTQNFRFRWLWAAITLIQKFIATKTTTFSEMAGRQLSYGIPGYLLKIFALDGVIGKNAKKIRFCPFSVSRRWKKVRGQHSDNLKLLDVPRAHFEAFYLYSWGNILKLASPKKTLF